MSHGVAILLTFIATMFWIVSLENDIRKDYQKAGFIPIDGKIYRLVVVEK